MFKFSLSALAVASALTATSFLSASTADARTCVRPSCVLVPKPLVCKGAFGIPYPCVKVVRVCSTISVCVN